MATLATKLGKSYGMVQDQVRIKTITIDVGSTKFDLKVRIPLKAEMEALLERVSAPSEARVDAIYKRLSKPVLDSIKEGGENFLSALNSEKEMLRILDNDVILDGNSIRQVAQFNAIMETRVEEYFHLLQSELGDSIDETYEQIAGEFPEPIIKQIVEAIEGAIRPDYKTAKKN
jgi:hypothetical protein